MLLCMQANIHQGLWDNLCPAHTAWRPLQQASFCTKPLPNRATSHCERKHRPTSGRRQPLLCSPGCKLSMPRAQPTAQAVKTVSIAHPLHRA